MDAVEVVKKTYARFEQGDLEGVGEMCTPDTVWHLRSNMPAGSVPWVGRHYGPEAVKANFLGAMGQNIRLDRELLRMSTHVLVNRRMEVNSRVNRGAINDYEHVAPSSHPVPCDGRVCESPLTIWLSFATICIHKSLAVL